MQNLGIVIDQGGTNIRFALVDINTKGVLFQKDYICANYKTVNGAFAEFYLDGKIELGSIEKIAMGVAGFIIGDIVQITNNSWNFSISSLAKSLQCKNFQVFNDFEALALSTLFLSDQDKEVILKNEKQEGTKLVVGPGTGLGIAALYNYGSLNVPIRTEGGYLALATTSQKQENIKKMIKKQHIAYQDITYEDVISGYGIMNIYNALCDLAQEEKKYKTPEEVTKAFVKGEERAKETVTAFFDFFINYMSNMAVLFMATGGIYIAGGIIPKLKDAFKEHFKKENFTQKEKFEEFLADIPIFLITCDYPAFLGLIGHISKS